LKNRTRLLSIIILAVLQCILVAGCLVWAHARLSNSLEEMRSAQSLYTNMANLSLLANEFMPDNAPRLSAQWKVAFGAQANLLIQHRSRHGMAGTEGLGKLLERTDILARRCFELSDPGQQGRVDALYRALLQHFSTTVYEAGEQIKQLVLSRSNQLERDQRIATALALVLMGALGLFVVAWLFSVRRSLVRLQAVTVHRDELAAELQLREIAEAALQKAQQGMLTAIEIERSRIGQELHDGVGQALTAVRLLLESSPGNGQGPVQRKKLCEYLLQASEDLRCIVNDLRPAALEDMGLGAALRSLVRQVEGTGLEVSLDLPRGEDDIPPALCTQVYRIVQETLHNVRRHAQAKKVYIQLVLGSELVLTVEDDGVGFEPDSETLGNGLSSIRSRARTWGGEARIESRPGQGTLLTVAFPT